MAGSEKFPGTEHMDTEKQQKTVLKRGERTFCLKKDAEKRCFMKEPLRMNQLFGVRQVSFTKQTVSVYSPFRNLQ